MAFLVAKHRLAALPIVAKPNVDCISFHLIFALFPNIFSVQFVDWKQSSATCSTKRQDKARRNYYRFIKVIHALPTPISHQTTKPLNHFNGVVAKMVLIDWFQVWVWSWWYWFSKFPSWKYFLGGTSSS